MYRSLGKTRRRTYGVLLMALIIRLGLLFSSKQGQHALGPSPETHTAYTDDTALSDSSDTEPDNATRDNSNNEMHNEMHNDTNNNTDNNEHIATQEEQRAQQGQPQAQQRPQTTDISVDLVSHARDLQSSYGNDRVALEQNYKQNPRSETLVALIEKLLHHFQFAKAYDYIIIAQQNGDLDLLQPHTVLYGLFNSSLVGQNTKTEVLRQFVDYYVDRGLLMQSDEIFYQCLIDIGAGLWTSCDNLYPTRQVAPYDDFARGLRARWAPLEQFPDLDPGYKHGMLALHLFEHGYFALAQQISIRLAIDYPQYILPKQILGYTHFVMHNWSTSQAYFLELMDNDPANKELYTFLIGVSQYHLGDYYEALLYLQQSTAIPDALRYMILSYDRLGQEDELMTRYKQLWSLGQVMDIDYISLTEEILLAGWIQQKKLTDQGFFDQIQQSCQSTRDVCDYLRAGIIVYQDLQQAGRLLQDNALSSSYAHYILGEYYLSLDEREDAITHFAKALMTSNDDLISTRAQQKLESLTG